MIGLGTSGGSDTDQLKALLEIAADPKKLAELQKANGDSKALLEERSRIEASIVAKLATLAVESENMDRKMFELNARETTVVNQERAYASSASDLTGARQEIARFRAQLEKDQKDHEIYKKTKLAELVDRESKLITKELQLEVDADALTAWRARIKQAVG